MRIAAQVLHRAPPRHFRGLMGIGLGDCQVLPGNPFCRDNATGSLVDCASPQCSAATAPAPGTWSTNDPILDGGYVYQNVPKGGFTGDFHVMTLDSFLAQSLGAKESPFIANAIARGADSIANESDFGAVASDYCNNNGGVSDCNPATRAQLVAKYTKLLSDWGGSQHASVYQAGDTGTLATPISTISNAPPVFTPAPPPATGNTGNTGGNTGNTGGNTGNGQQQQQQQQQQQAPAKFDWSFLTNEAIGGIPNWVLGGAVLAGLYLIPMFLRGRR